MPTYVFKCTQCAFEYEFLSSYDKSSEPQTCPECQGRSERQMTTFAIKSSIDSKKDTIFTPKEIDLTVGKESDKRWQVITNRQEKRRGDKKLEVLNIPKEKDGRMSPLQHLGDSKEREFRKTYSETLKEHRVDRKRKGLEQFAGPGSIAE